MAPSVAEVAAPHNPSAVMRGIHDQRRSARMNCIYYEKRLKRLQQQNLALELAIALATSSGVAGLAFWKSPTGQVAWGTIAALGAMASVVKPLLGLPRRIETATQLRQGYLHSFQSFSRLVLHIETRGEVTAGHVEQAEKLTDEVEALSKQDEIDPRIALLRRAQEQVMTEIPQASLWMPPIPATSQN